MEMKKPAGKEEVDIFFEKGRLYFKGVIAVKLL
jgi:hypothetical protein